MIPVIRRQQPVHSSFIGRPNFDLLGPDALVWHAGNPGLLTGSKSFATTGDASGSYRSTRSGLARTYSRVASAGANFGAIQHVLGLECTVLVVGAPTASTNRRIAWSQRTSGSNAAQWWAAFNSDGALGASSGTIALVARNTGAVTGAATALSQFDGAPHCWVLGRGVSSGYVYRDGVAQALGANVAPTGTVYVNTQHTRIGNIGDYTTDGAFVCDDPLSLVIVWPRVLDEAQALMLSAVLGRNISEAFEPRRIMLPVSVAGSVPTLVSIAASSITSTGAVLTVN